MRLWSLHPRVLDRAALVACWREALLAQKVLAGLTRGYTRHPQLERFRATEDPLTAIGHFLTQVQLEATARGYRFDASRITVPGGANPAIPVTEGQLAYETTWLRSKVDLRAPEWAQRVTAEAAPSFVVGPGPIESWERVAG
ncbi:pyrimidine dimer DNA glycosylase/endonuclease V [Microbacterium gorillae]|uniref:pyrimidine dimer DNA glycosylase/endonuclease V n=1 Tax=Microbacterium gorillae TaxID=1231063 RepID=UPI00058DFF53|nr:pyrimidine dimer DNA glycosylase/endonuclease V [Microbacterium gorillae]